MLQTTLRPWLHAEADAHFVRANEARAFAFHRAQRRLGRVVGDVAGTLPIVQFRARVADAVRLIPAVLAPIRRG